jgi:hypothetical protein
VIRRTGSDSTVAVATVITVVVAAIAGICVAVLFVGGRSFFEFGVSERRHLDEIPIDEARACGSVEAIHDALDSFNGTYTAAMLGIDAKQLNALMAVGRSSAGPPTTFTSTPWPTVASGLDASAQRLDLVLADGIPHFPARVQRQLTVVRDSIVAGRRQLPKVDDVAALTQLTHRAFDRGKLHAGYASDLVGDQCSVPLGA